jgi:hypothetical protein
MPVEVLPMTGKLKSAFTLSAATAALMALQAALGLALQPQYRDIPWIRATWFGNDGVTLLVAVPALAISLALARRGSVRGLLGWLGILGYGAYNYAYYMFGAAINAFMPLYVLLEVLCVVALIVTLTRVDPVAVASSFRPRATTRIVAGYLVFMATGLAFAWLAQWAGHVFAGAKTPIEPEAFKLVAVMDLSVMVTAMGFGGVMLWRRQPWGHVLAPIAAVQGAMYLLVLTVNSGVAIARGFATDLGEVPVWGTACVFTTLAAALLLAAVAPGARSHVREGRLEAS